MRISRSHIIYCYYYVIIIYHYVKYFDKPSFLILVGEDSNTIEDVLQSIEERWTEVNQTIEERQKKIRSLMELNRLQNEAEAISRVLESHQKWLHSTDKQHNPDDVPKLLDQCKVSFDLSHI